MSRKKHSKETILIWTKLPEESIIQYVRRIIKQVKWLTVIVFIIGLPSSIWGGVQLYNYIKDNSRMEKLRYEIDSKKTIIKESVYPEFIDLEDDSIGELVLIKKYQDASLEYCSLYETLSTSKIKEVYKTNTKQWSFMALQYVLGIKEMDSLYNVLYDTEIELLSCASRNNIKEYERLDLTKIRYMMNERHQRSDIFVDQVHAFEKHIKRNDFKKCSEMLDDFMTNETRLKEMDAFFSCMIDCNKILNKRLKYYQMKHGRNSNQTKED